MHPYKEKNGNDLCLLPKMYAKVERIREFQRVYQEISH